MTTHQARTIIDAMRADHEARLRMCATWRIRPGVRLRQAAAALRIAAAALKEKRT